jgi:hypothetical protein
VDVIEGGKEDDVFCEGKDIEKDGIVGTPDHCGDCAEKKRGPGPCHDCVGDDEGEGAQIWGN